MEDDIIDREGWKRLAEVYDEQTLTKKHIEVELWHRGRRKIMWTKLRRIARDEKGDKAIETWETEGKRGAAEQFSVLLPGNETLESHIQYTNYMGTQNGGNIFTIAMVTGLIILEILTLLMAFGQFGDVPNLADPLFVLPTGLIAGLMIGTFMVAERSVAGVITLECACPDDEESNRHAVYVCHSTVANVIEQLDKQATHLQLYHELITMQSEHLNQQRILIMDRNRQLETMLDDTKVTNEYIDERRLGNFFRRGQSQKGTTMPWAYILGLLALGMMITAGVSWYVFGAK